MMSEPEIRLPPPPLLPLPPPPPPPPRLWVLEVIAAAFVLFVIVGSVAMYVSLRNLNESNHEVLVSQVPGLKKQIADRDATIAEQQDLMKQLTDAVILQSKKLSDHGIDPGQITIRPKSTTTTTAPKS